MAIFNVCIRQSTCAFLGISFLTGAVFADPDNFPAAGRETGNRPSAQPLQVPGFVPARPAEELTVPRPKSDDEVADRLSAVLLVDQIIVDGNDGLLPEDKIKELIAPYHGQVSVAALEELRQKLTKLCVEEGFINSGAVIPEGAYQKGTLRYQLIFGRLSAAHVRGQERLREGYIANRLLGGKDEPLNLNELQDRYQLLRSDPLFSSLSARLVPGDQPAQSILDVQVERAKPYGLTVFGDNYRPPSIGAEGFGVTGWVRNLTGLGDSLDFSFITSEGTDRYFGGMSLPVTDWGTEIFFRFDEGDNLVIEQPVKDLKIRSQVHSLEGGISHPIINSFRERLTVGVLLAIRENETSLDNTPFSFVPGQTSPQNQVTVWRLFQDSNRRWERHALAFRSTFSVGMEALGATVQKDPRYPDSDFFSWLGQSQYAYLLADNGTQLVLRGTIQRANNPLLPLEQIAVGGVGTVRGYRVNQLVRDEGHVFNLELHYPVIGGNEPDVKHRLTLIPFLDYGEAKNLSGDSNELFSVGVGFNWSYDRFYSEFYYGYAIKKPDPSRYDDLQDHGVQFQVRLNLL